MLKILWLLSAGRPESLFERYEIVRKQGTSEGIYEFGKGLDIRLVVISELPMGRDTLLLRLMGPATVRKQAMEEIRRLPPDDPDALSLQRLLTNLRHTFSRATNISNEQREELMTTSWAYVERFEQEAIEKGIGKGKALLLLRVLQARGLPVSDEVRQRILNCPDSSQLDLWADRAVRADRTEDIFITA